MRNVNVLRPFFFRIIKYPTPLIPVRNEPLVYIHCKINPLQRRRHGDGGRRRRRVAVPTYFKQKPFAILIYSGSVLFGLIVLSYYSKLFLFQMKGLSFCTRSADRASALNSRYFTIPYTRRVHIIHVHISHDNTTLSYYYTYTTV